MAKLDVQATFTLATNQAPGPLWLTLSVNTQDGQVADLRFPNPVNPDPAIPWPVRAFVIISERGGGVLTETMITEVRFLAFELPGMYRLEIATKEEGSLSLADLSPLQIGVIVEAGADRGQAIALASQSMHLDR